MHLLHHVCTLIYSAAFNVVDQIIGSPKQYQSEKPFPYKHEVLVTIIYLHRSDPLGMENVSLTMCATITVHVVLGLLHVTRGYG